MVKAYERVIYHGHTLNRRTKAMVQQAENYLGYQLTILQGSYHKGVGASAGTHDGGGAVDFAPADVQNKIMTLRMVGFAAWHRLAIPNVWPEHIHAIAIKDKEMSAAAATQIVDYYHHLDGLADHRWDYQWRPHVICSFQYPLLNVNEPRVFAEYHKDKDHQKLVGVMRVQRALNTKAGTHLRVDGIFGPKTKAAFNDYSRATGTQGKRALTRLGLALFGVKE